MEVKVLASLIMGVSALMFPFLCVIGVYTAIKNLKKDKNNSEQLANSITSTLLTFILASNRGKNIDPSIFNQQGNGFVDYNDDFYDYNDSNKKEKLLLNNNIKSNKKGYIKSFLTGVGFSLVSFILLYIFFV